MSGTESLLHEELRKAETDLAFALAQGDARAEDAAAKRIETLKASSARMAEATYVNDYEESYAEPTWACYCADQPRCCEVEGACCVGCEDERDHRAADDEDDDA